MVSPGNVGHACGGTVQQVLVNERERLREHIYRFNNNNPLNHHDVFDTVHVHPVRWPVLEATQRVLIVLRDPVERFISAYNTNACMYEGHSDRCDRQYLNTMRLKVSNANAEAEASAMIEFNRSMSCFPNITSFAEQLDDDTECGRRARDLTRPPWESHVKKGSCYYLDPAMRTMLENKSVHIIHTEMCNTDIRRIPEWLGLDMQFSHRPKHYETHTEQFPHHDDQPTNRGRVKLHRHLKHEYKLQEHLEELVQRQRQGKGLAR